MEKLYADPNGKNTDLQKYAASAALKNAEADAKRAHDGKRVYKGEVTVVNPTVTSLNIDRKIPNAAISSCLDISRWEVTHADTGKPVELPASRLTKYLIVSTVERYPDGWRVIRDEPQGKSC
ncbi:secreted protein/lipoprotein [Streptomyces scopuliridis]|uniref:secreted protein/lipoprotein n=1 Tax=Streptomyces scopuliridis TaxID=452529 RepID=UPI003434C0EE